MKPIKFKTSHDLAEFLLRQPDMPFRIPKVKEYDELLDTLTVMLTINTLYSNPEEREGRFKSMIIQGVGN